MALHDNVEALVSQLLAEVQALSALKVPDFDSSAGTVQTGDAVGDFKHNWRAVLPRFSEAIQSTLRQSDALSERIRLLGAAISDNEPNLEVPVATITRVAREYTDELGYIYVLSTNATTFDGGARFVGEVLKHRLRANQRGTELVVSVLAVVLQLAVRRMTPRAA